jgi:hypothetical protein
MEKTLTFKDNGKEYKLAFTRETIIMTENAGFRIGEIVEKPIGSLLLLWRGAFLANHNSLDLAEVDEIFDRIDKKGLLDALLDLYNAPVISLFDEDNSKNAVKWTVN